MMNSLVEIQVKARNNYIQWLELKIAPWRMDFKIVMWVKFVHRILSVCMGHAVALSSQDQKKPFNFFYIAIILHRNSAFQIRKVKPHIHFIPNIFKLVYLPPLLIKQKLEFTIAISGALFLCCMDKNWNSICLLWQHLYWLYIQIYHDQLF